MSTRRDILKNLLGTAFAASGLGSHGASAQMLEMRNAGLASALETLADSSDVIFWRDDDHRDVHLRTPLLSANVLRGLRQKGVTELFIEFNPVFQPDIDRLYEGRMSSQKRQTFIETVHKNLQDILEKGGIDLNDKKTKQQLAGDLFLIGLNADIIISAKHAGIKVYGADHQPLTEIYEIQKMPVAAQNKALEKRLKKYDPVAADYIQTVRTGKALVVFGTHHSESRMDENIDDVLRARGVTTSAILMTNKFNYDKKFFENLQAGKKQTGQMLFGTGYDIPDVVYEPKTGRIARFGSETIIVGKDRFPHRPDPAPAIFIFPRQLLP